MQQARGHPCSVGVFCFCLRGSRAPRGLSGPQTLKTSSWRRTRPLGRPLPGLAPVSGTLPTTACLSQSLPYTKFNDSPLPTGQNRKLLGMKYSRGPCDPAFVHHPSTHLSICPSNSVSLCDSHVQPSPQPTPVPITRSRLSRQ